VFDQRALRTSDGIAASAIEDIVTDGRGAVIVSSVAGAGKSHLVARAAGRLADDGARVVVTCPTNEQAYGLVERIAELNPAHHVVFCPATGRALPPHVEARANVSHTTPQDADHHQILVATMDKLRDARGRGYLATRDRLLLDEAYQADSARYYAVAGMADRHMLVGDSGQLDPFTSAREAERWRGLTEDPIQSAVAVLLRNHPDASLHHRLPVTRRLDPRGAAMAQSFYPGQAVGAAVLDGVRRLELAPGLARERGQRALDSALNHAATAGWAHLELPPGPSLVGDPQIAAAIVALVSRLLERGPRVTCEQLAEFRPLSSTRVAIGVSHREQRRLLRAMLDATGLSDVPCETANRLQGLQFDVVVVWHPLAGLPEADPFHLDPGRLAVLMTRHRHACVLVSREGDEDLVAGIPPATPAYLGVPGDPILDGFASHAEVFGRLEHVRVPLPVLPS